MSQEHIEIHATRKAAASSRRTATAAGLSEMDRQELFGQDFTTFRGDPAPFRSTDRIMLSQKVKGKPAYRKYQLPVRSILK